MPPILEHILLGDEKVPSHIVAALKAAMQHSDCDRFAHSYSDAMTRSYVEHGLRGVKVQAMYLMNNMGKWNGEEARESKKILKKWCAT